MALLKRLGAKAGEMKTEAAKKPTDHRDFRFRAGGYFYKRDEGQK